MSINKKFSAAAVVLGVVLSGSVLAGSGDVVTPTGEIFHVPAASTANKTAAEVRQELAEFQADPRSADGAYRYVGGEAGWVPVPHAFAYRDGGWQHVDTFRHDQKAPSLAMTPEEQAARGSLYLGG